MTKVFVYVVKFEHLFKNKYPLKKHLSKQFTLKANLNR